METPQHILDAVSSKGLPDNTYICFVLKDKSGPFHAKMTYPQGNMVIIALFGYGDSAQTILTQLISSLPQPELPPSQ